MYFAPSQVVLHSALFSVEVGIPSVRSGSPCNGGKVLLGRHRLEVPLVSSFSLGTNSLSSCPSLFRSLNLSVSQLGAVPASCTVGLHDFRLASARKEDCMRDMFLPLRSVSSHFSACCGARQHELTCWVFTLEVCSHRSFSLLRCVPRLRQGKTPLPGFWGVLDPQTCWSCIYRFMSLLLRM